MTALVQRVAHRTGLEEAAVVKALELVETGSSGSEQEREEAVAHLALAMDARDLEGPAVDRPIGKPIKTPRELLPEVRVTSDAVLRSLRGEVVQVRSELFGSPEPPFPDLAAAVEWIESASQRPEVGPRERDRAEQLQEEIRARVAELESLLGWPIRFWLESPTLEYPKPPDDWVHAVRVPRGSPLLPLASVTRRLSVATGHRQAALVGYVLAGAEPRLPRCRISHAVRYPGPLSLVTLTFNAQNIGWADLRQVYDQVRAARGGRATLIDADDERLWEVVNDFGGLTTGRQGERLQDFWGRVRDEIAARGGKDYRTWNGPMMRWRRLMEQQPWLKHLLEASELSSQDEEA